MLALGCYVVKTGNGRPEPLWSPVVATGGNRSRIARPQKPEEQAQAVAVACDLLPFPAHGKEGSPVRVRKRALQKRRRSALFGSSGFAPRRTCDRWSP